MKGTGIDLFRFQRQQRELSVLDPNVKGGCEHSVANLLLSFNLSQNWSSCTNCSGPTYSPSERPKQNVKITEAHRDHTLLSLPLGRYFQNAKNIDHK